MPGAVLLLDWQDSGPAGKLLLEPIGFLWAGGQRRLGIGLWGYQGGEGSGPAGYGRDGPGELPKGTYARGQPTHHPCPLWSQGCVTSAQGQNWRGPAAGPGQVRPRVASQGDLWHLKMLDLQSLSHRGLEVTQNRDPGQSPTPGPVNHLSL